MGARIAAALRPCLRAGVRRDWTCFLRLQYLSLPQHALQERLHAEFCGNGDGFVLDLSGLAADARDPVFGRAIGTPTLASIQEFAPGCPVRVKARQIHGHQISTRLRPVPTHPNLLANSAPLTPSSSCAVIVTSNPEDCTHPSISPSE